MGRFGNNRPNFGPLSRLIAIIEEGYDTKDSLRQKLYKTPGYNFFHMFHFYNYIHILPSDPRAGGGGGGGEVPTESCSRTAPRRNRAWQRRPFTSPPRFHFLPPPARTIVPWGIRRLSPPPPAAERVSQFTPTHACNFWRSVRAWPSSNKSTPR